MPRPNVLFIMSDQHVEGSDPFAALGFTRYDCDAHSYGKQVGAEIQERYNKANIISEMWEHSYRNVEGQPFSYPESQMWDTMITDACLDFLDCRDEQEPFFTYVGYRAPHPPWCAPERFHRMYDPGPSASCPTTGSPSPTNPDASSSVSTTTNCGTCPKR